jgi:phosphoribosyl 1,2-cyclic phosphodiesterase
MKLKAIGSGSKGNCYILEGEAQTLLLECGLKWKDILKGLDYNVADVAGCLISHSHSDHSKSLNDVLKAGIDVYGIKDIFTGVNFHVHPIESGKQVSIGDFKVMPFALEHDVPSLGFLIQCEDTKLVYITDTAYCRYKFKELTSILIEANYSEDLLNSNLYNDNIVLPVRDRVVESHMSLETCTEFLQANDLSKVKNIVLLHLSDNNSDAEMFKQKVEGLTGIPTYAAEKGLEIEI